MAAKRTRPRRRVKSGRAGPGCSSGAEGGHSVILTPARYDCRVELTVDLMLAAYSQGAFPMAESADSPTVGFYRPDPRGIMPLDDRFRVRRSLAKRVRNGGFDIRVNAAFNDVVEACAAPRPETAGGMKVAEADGTPSGTWINPAIRRVFGELHDAGFAHSVETWRSGRLVGGLYGLSLGGAFFGESMFSREKDASQVALVALVQRLRSRGFTLLDTQFNNPHIAQFGVQEIPAAEYERRLRVALRQPVAFDDPAD